MPQNRARTGEFQPGESGNPGGRPAAIAEVRDLARAHTADAMNALVEIANDKKASAAARVSAAVAILDRGWGKPAQPIDGSMEVHHSVRSVLTELEKLDLGLPTAMPEFDDGPGSTRH